MKVRITRNRHLPNMIKPVFARAKSFRIEISRSKKVVINCEYPNVMIPNTQLILLTISSNGGVSK